MINCIGTNFELTPLTYLYFVLRSATSDVPLKFALFSAHDTSLMPFLAAVMGDRWDGRWAGYAYMISIELYAASASSSLGAGGHYFRLYYNGEILTLPGCDAQLCDANVLLDALAYGQESMPCSVPTVTPSDTENCDDSDNSLSTTHWVLIALLTFALGSVLGAGSIVYVNKRKMIDGSGEVVGGLSTHPLHGGNAL